MPELPEMEAWRRQLDAPVSAFPIAKAGPAHIATLKTFDPPLSALEARRLAGAPRPRGARLRRRPARGAPPGRVAPPALAPPRPTADRRHRPRVGERDPAPGAAIAVRALPRPDARGGGAARGRDRLGARARPRAPRARRERRANLSRPRQARPALLRLRHPDRPRRLRRAHDPLLPDVPDGGPRPQGPPA